MNEAPAAASAYRALRVWPVLLLCAIGLILRYLPSLWTEGPPGLWMAAAFGPALCGALAILWWLTLSRATGGERIFGLVGICLAFGLTISTIHPTMRGPAVLVLTIPLGLGGFALGTILLGRTLAFRRSVVAVLLALLGFGYSVLLRSEGMWGDFHLALFWRWEPTAEEALVSRKAEEAPPPAVALDGAAATAVDEALTAPEWPGFRGADRSGRQRGQKFELDWKTQPPVELWKIAIGPGWSSFAVAGDLLFTQEQRGPEELVSCYDARSGREVWTRAFEARFDDPMGGPGPRATPTLAEGALFALGATGTLARLDPRTGALAWEQNIHRLSLRKERPMWGYCASPLVVDGVVVVHAGGEDPNGIIALDTTSGERRWGAASGEMSYSSPQLTTVLGESSVLMTDQGLDFLDPGDGKLRFAYVWPFKGYRALQPWVLDEGGVLLPTGVGAGTRRIHLASSAEGWKASEEWTSRHLKPDFNDLVVHEGHIYGFDNSIFTCLDLATGERKWKGGRYGKGQALLLEDSGAIFVITEKGEGVVLAADPAAHRELARLPMLQGKTWNHPVVVGDRLFVRNAQEAAAYRLRSL